MGVRRSSHGALIGQEFFLRDPLICAREMIGCRLQWGACSGIVVETEAYDSEGDEASHTFFRPSTRAFVQAHPAGTAYVYLNYGMHWMLNVLVKGKREGFVLFRGLEPLEGIDLMKAARGVEDVRQLCSGPGKLARALGITRAQHGMDLCADPAFAFYRGTEKRKVVASPRIGITRSVDFPWRFCAEGSLHTSRAQKKRPERGMTLFPA